MRDHLVQDQIRPHRESVIIVGNQHGDAAKRVNWGTGFEHLWVGSSSLGGTRAFAESLHAADFVTVVSAITGTPARALTSQQLLSQPNLTAPTAAGGPALSGGSGDGGATGGALAENWDLSSHQACSG